MFFKRKPLYVPEPPRTNPLEITHELRKSDQELATAQRQAIEASIVVNSAKETRRQNHFAPNLAATFQRKA